MIIIESRKKGSLNCAIKTRSYFHWTKKFVVAQRCRNLEFRQLAKFSEWCFKTSPKPDPLFPFLMFITIQNQD